jgi:hypothetical protein
VFVINPPAKALEPAKAKNEIQTLSTDKNYKSVDFVFKLFVFKYLCFLFCHFPKPTSILKAG